MASNPHWPRWIFASISKHFSDRKGSYTLYIEGQPRTAPQPADLLELRVDGPYLTEYSKGEWYGYVEVSILQQTILTDTNYHNLATMQGLVASAFTDIQCYKYGTGVADDQSFFGCLKLIQDPTKRERIQINNFGIIDPATQMMQGTVEGHFRIELTA